jgi:hypothetical protein
MFDALVALGKAQAAVLDAPDDDVRAELWSVWVRALARVFAAADRGWEHARELLA